MHISTNIYLRKPTKEFYKLNRIPLSSSIIGKTITDINIECGTFYGSNSPGFISFKLSNDQYIILTIMAGSFFTYAKTNNGVFKNVDGTGTTWTLVNIIPKICCRKNICQTS